MTLNGLMLVCILIKFIPKNGYFLNEIVFVLQKSLTTEAVRARVVEALKITMERMVRAWALLTIHLESVNLELQRQIPSIQPVAAAFTVAPAINPTKLIKKFKLPTIEAIKLIKISIVIVLIIRVRAAALSAPPRKCLSNEPFSRTFYPFILHFLVVYFPNCCDQLIILL